MKKTILIAAVMFCALSVSAFAQVGSTFTVGSDTVTTLRCCGIAERTGDITFTTVPNTTPSIAGTMTVRYNVPITTTTGVQGPMVQVFDASGVPNGAAFAPLTAENVNGVGTIIFAVPPDLTPPFSIALSGVRVNVSAPALCGTDTNITATITSTGNQLTSGETVVTVASSVAQPLTDPEVEAAVSINRVTGIVESPAEFTFKVGEAFFDAFGTTPAEDPTQNQGFQIRLNLSAIPAGVTLTFPPTSADGLFELVNSQGVALGVAQAVTAGTTTVFYELATPSDPATLEEFEITVGVSASTANLPLANTPITITAQPAPVAVGSVPRFTETGCVSEDAVTVVTFFGANTTLLIPYATNAVGYDTGIAIANTTKDPGTTAMGLSSAVPQAGSLTFYFFPQDGSASFQVTPTSGHGLNAAGEVPIGGSFIVLLSELLEMAEVEEEFSGYIFVVTNFTNAHGQYFVSDFENFTNGALALVVDDDRSDTPESLGQ